MGRDSSTTGLHYHDLAHFPDDGLRRELIGGALVVTPAPTRRHQRTCARIVRALWRYADAHGGEPLSAPFDVRFTNRDVVEPDVLFLREPTGDERYATAPPDLVVEVSSPTTKGVDRVKKRALYEHHGVPEYWIVDLDEDVIEVYALASGRYGDPELVRPGETLDSPTLQGLVARYEELVVPGKPATGRSPSTPGIPPA